MLPIGSLYFVRVGVHEIFTSQTTFKGDTTFTQPLKDLGLVVKPYEKYLEGTDLCKEIQAYFDDYRTRERVYFDSC